MKKNKKKRKKAILKDMARNMWRIFRIVWQDNKSGLFSILLLTLLLSIAPFLQSGASALVINELVNILSGGAVTNYFYYIAVAFLLVGFLMPITSTLDSYFFRLFYFYLEEKFEILLTKKKGDIDIAVREDPKKNNLINKVMESGVWRIQNFSERQFYVLEGLISTVIASFIIFSFNWWLFFIILIATIPDWFVEMRYGNRVYNIHTGKAEIKRRFWDVRDHFYRTSDVVELKIFQNTRYFIDIIKDLFKSFRDEEKKNERKKQVSRFIALFISEVVIAFSIIWFIYVVISGQMQIGTFTFVIASIAGLRRSLANLFSSLGRQYQDSLFITDVFKFLDLKPVIKKAKKAVSLESGATPEIVFDNVGFIYPGTNRTVLKNFTLTIKPGEKFALVGVNGAGKTTLVKLLCRFYDPNKGNIYINGINLKDIDLESWYNQLGVLFQDYSQYHFYVKQAIALGRTGKKTDLEKVKEAAKAGEADIFIEEWERSYNQMLGKEFTKGIEPSIGQWQKLGLARVFYRDPKVLILDEPTSSIDAESEAKIFDRIESTSKERTVILISHRFSTVRQANKIVVINHGRLQELGTHEQLMKKDGTYARLFKLQAEKYH